MIKPSIGRVVWFWPGAHDAELGNFHDKTQPLAAIVAYVWSDTLVNLAIFDPNGESHHRTSVTLWQGDLDDPARPKEFFAEWMPFQIGQAAKAEALEKQAGVAVVDSGSDNRVVNNVVRHQYRVLGDAEKANMQAVKDKGLQFLELVTGLGNSRETSIARTKIEEAVMWAVKHITA